jgi:hypothetical protein
LKAVHEPGRTGHIFKRQKNIFLVRKLYSTYCSIQLCSSGRLPRESPHITPEQGVIQVWVTVFLPCGFDNRCLLDEAKK